MGIALSPITARCTTGALPSVSYPTRRNIPHGQCGDAFRSCLGMRPVPSFFPTLTTRYLGSICGVQVRWKVKGMTQKRLCENAWSHSNPPHGSVEMLKILPTTDMPLLFLPTLPTQKHSRNSAGDEVDPRQQCEDHEHVECHSGPDLGTLKKRTQGASLL